MKLMTYAFKMLTRQCNLSFWIVDECFSTANGFVFLYHSLCITQNDERNPFVISSINFRKMSVQIFTKNHIEFFLLCANLLLYLSWQRMLLLIMPPLPLLYMNCVLSWPLSGASMEKVDSIKFNCAPHDTFHHRVHSFIYILLIQSRKYLQFSV